MKSQKSDRNIVLFVYNMILTGLGLRFHRYLHSEIGPDHFRPEKNKEIRKFLIFPSSTE